MLEIKHLYHSFPIGETLHPVIQDLDFTVNAHDFFVILGQSGCGKSTLLRLIGGFLHPDSGSILLDGIPVTSPSGDMMMVFQSFDQLFPWYTLKDNLIYAMKKAHLDIPVHRRSHYAAEYLKLAGLEEFQNSYPHQLSGGMKQRGALARALCLKPRLLLMDEPFSSLDYITKRNSYDSIRHMVSQTGCTIILVTHDIEEALLLGTSIAVFSRTQKQFKEIHVNTPGNPDPGLKTHLEGQLIT